MAASTAELTLLIKARNLTNAAIGQVNAGINSVVTTAENAGRKIGHGFENGINAVSNAIGNFTENILSGQDVGSSFLMLGVYLGGQMAEGLIGQLLEKVAGSSIIEVITAPIAALGSTIGEILGGGISVGALAWPALLLAAVVAAVVFLINNPKLVDDILKFAGSVIDFIMKGL